MAILVVYMCSILEVRNLDSSIEEHLNSQQMTRILSHGIILYSQKKFMSSYS
jgi:hypothetical protein